MWGIASGRAWAGQFAGVEKRVKAHVLMAGFGDTAHGWNIAAERRISSPGGTAGRNPLRGSRTPIVLFQWASRDEFLTAEDLEIFFNVAKEPKEKRWFDADHSFNHAALRDRAVWLARQFAFAPA